MLLTTVKKCCHAWNLFANDKSVVAFIKSRKWAQTVMARSSLRRYSQMFLVSLCGRHSCIHLQQARHRDAHIEGAIPRERSPS